MKRICNALAKLNWEKARAVFVLCAATAMSLPAQTLTTLHSFYGKGGEDPWAGLVQAINGDLYGTTVLALLRRALQLRDARLNVFNLDGLGAVRQHQFGRPEFRGRRRVLVQHDLQHGGNRRTGRLL
jgi:hypothetical protein